MRSFLFLSALLFALLPIRANLLTPGNSVSPDSSFNFSTITLLASTSGSGTSGSDSFSYVEAVLRDSNNVFASGDLDFVLQVSNTATGGGQDITDVEPQSYAGFSTDVGYTSSGSSLTGGLFVDGSAIPAAIARNAAGSQLDFQFNSLIVDGVTSDALVIETNATMDDSNGVLGFLFGVNDPASTILEPVNSSVPEPASAALLGGGLMLALMLRRKLGPRRS